MRLENQTKTRVWEDSSICSETLTKNAVQEFHLNTQPPTGLSHGDYSVSKIAGVRATKQSGPSSCVICRATNPDRSSSSSSLSGPNCSDHHVSAFARNFYHGDIFIQHYFLCRLSYSLLRYKNIKVENKTLQIFARTKCSLSFYLSCWCSQLLSALEAI